MRRPLRLQSVPRENSAARIRKIDPPEASAIGPAPGRGTPAAAQIRIWPLSATHGRAISSDLLGGGNGAALATDANLAAAIAEYEKAVALVSSDDDIRPTLALANALARQSAGHTNLLAVLTPNLAVKPATVLVTKTSVPPGSRKMAIEQVKSALDVLPKLGFKLSYTEEQAAKLVDLRSKLECEEKMKKLEDAISGLNVDIATSLLLTEYGQALNTTDEEFKDQIEVSKELRELLFSLVKK